jgi:hypothetical protein
MKGQPGRDEQVKEFLLRMALGAPKQELVAMRKTWQILVCFS